MHNGRRPITYSNESERTADYDIDDNLNFKVAYTTIIQRFKG